MKEKLTTVFGAPVADNNNSMTAGPKGPMLMQDVWYLEKMVLQPIYSYSQPVNIRTG